MSQDSSAANAHKRISEHELSCEKRHTDIRLWIQRIWFALLAVAILGLSENSLVYKFIINIAKVG